MLSASAPSYKQHACVIENSKDLRSPGFDTCGEYEQVDHSATVLPLPGCAICCGSGRQAEGGEGREFEAKRQERDLIRVFARRPERSSDSSLLLFLAVNEVRVL